MCIILYRNQDLKHTQNHTDAIQINIFYSDSPAWFREHAQSAVDEYIIIDAEKLCATLKTFLLILIFLKDYCILGINLQQCHGRWEQRVAICCIQDNPDRLTVWWDRI